MLSMQFDMLMLVIYGMLDWKSNYVNAIQYVDANHLWHARFRSLGQVMGELWTNVKIFNCEFSSYKA